MERTSLLEAADALEVQVASALASGYENATCVLTSEVVELIARIRAGETVAPIKLQFTAGPAWNFFETSLGECKQLESAWYGFKDAAEGYPYRGPIGGNAAWSIE